MKLSVCTYSFQKGIRENKITQMDTLYLAKELGFDAIEISGLRTPEGMTDAEYAKALRAEAERVGIEIPAYLIHLDFLQNDFEEELEKGKGHIDIAEILGASLIRHDVVNGRETMPFKKALPILADACRKMAEYGKEKGIRCCVENHGYYLQRAERLEKLYEAVDHENFGLLVDMGNFLCDDDVPPLAVSRLAPYACHVHAKDFFVKPASAPCPGASYNLISNAGCRLRPTIVGNGDADVYHCLAALKQRGYDGYVAVEFEGMEDYITAIAMGKANLELYFSQLGI